MRRGTVLTGLETLGAVTEGVREHALPTQDAYPLQGSHDRAGLSVGPLGWSHAKKGVLQR